MINIYSAFIKLPVPSAIFKKTYIFGRLHTKFGC